MKNSLTKREQEVISVLIQGKSNEEIGKNLHVSTNTVRTHLSSCYKKLKVKNRTELVVKYSSFK
tara:strand:- start:123 stop:314 length:192 start_codon:yes stop_codon:yes gene_type:complete